MVLRWAKKSSELVRAGSPISLIARFWIASCVARECLEASLLYHFLIPLNQSVFFWAFFSQNLVFYSLLLFLPKNMLFLFVYIFWERTYKMDGLKLFLRFCPSFILKFLTQMTQHTWLNEKSKNMVLNINHVGFCKWISPIRAKPCFTEISHYFQSLFEQIRVVRLPCYTGAISYSLFLKAFNIFYKYIYFVL